MNRPEQIIHKAVVEHLKIRGVPGLVYSIARTAPISAASVPVKAQS